MTWTGRKDTGGQTYTESDVMRVRKAMGIRVGRDRAISLEILRANCLLEARTLRAILSDRDGIDYVLSFVGEDGGSKAVFACEFADDAEGYTRRLMAQAETILERVTRRRRAVVAMGRKQAQLAL